MNLILKQKITGPAAWTANDIQQDNSWIHILDKSDIAEINTALNRLNATQIEYLTFGKADFCLPTVNTKLLAYSKELENGRGFFMLRGLDVNDYSEAELSAIYYGIGQHLGEPVGQNPRGDLLGAVENVGDPNDRNTRVYETNLDLPFHTDPSDVVALLCVRQAKQGGLSSLVSVAAIYNHILEQYPEYLGLYYKHYHYAHLGDNTPRLSPLFSYHHGKLSCRYLRQYVELGHEIMNSPLSRVEVAALDLLDQVMGLPELGIDMMLEPGDMQFANNYMVLHSRTAFTDHSEANKRRKLYRLWLKMPNARTLAEEFPGRNGFPLPKKKPENSNL